MTQEIGIYRSEIDKMIIESGYTGKSVAVEMGVTYNRMVALRRACPGNISTDDLRSCASAIYSLDKKRNKIRPVEPKNKVPLFLEERVSLIENKLADLIDKLGL